MLLLASLPSGTRAQTERLLVTIGDVTSTSAMVWARAAGPGPLTVAVGVAGGPLGEPRPIGVAPERDLTGRVVVRDLRPSTRYAYRLVAGGDRVTGEFLTAPRPDDPRPLTFLWSGDLGGAGFCRLRDGGYPIFRSMAPRRPDFFLFVGDTMYADVPCNKPGVLPGADFVATTLTQYHAKHRYNREDAAVQAFLRGTSVYAIWDDHEVRNDFSGSVEPLMPVGRRAFLDYWPIATLDGEPNRLHRRVRWGRLAEVFVLDTRQYRSPNAERDGPTKTMLGAAQREWFLDAIHRSDAVWKIVVSSIPLSVPTGRRERRDSWTNVGPFGLPDDGGTGFVHERDVIVRRLHARGIRNMIVLTADVHHAEIIRHEPLPGFVVHEFIAGPLSAGLGRPRPLDQALGARSVWARGGFSNFGEIAIEPGQLTVRILADDGIVVATHAVTAE